MSRNEIRMRRNRLTGHGADRFRNYGVVLERHERDQRIKKILKVFTLFAIILILIMLLIIVFRVEKKLEPTSCHKRQDDTSIYVTAITGWKNMPCSSNSG